MKLQVYKKCVYGIDQIYPACEKSKTLLRLLGLKVFTDKAWDVAEWAGYELEFVVTP